MRKFEDLSQLVFRPHIGLQPGAAAANRPTPMGAPSAAARGATRQHCRLSGREAHPLAALLVAQRAPARAQSPRAVARPALLREARVVPRTWPLPHRLFGCGGARPLLREHATLDHPACHQLGLLPTRSSTHLFPSSER